LAKLQETGATRDPASIEAVWTEETSVSPIHDERIVREIGLTRTWALRITTKRTKDEDGND
jgi:hypothetical protein